MAHPHDIGRQPEEKGRWKRRMRFHQSWWRANVLRVGYGTGPEESSVDELGSMLDSDGAKAGLNFLDDSCRKAYEQRKGSGVEPFRTERNLLSSQPMCFNLFGPLVVGAELRTPLLASLVDGVSEVVSAGIEWQQPKDLALLGDRTAFDAYVAYNSTDGDSEVLGIETKLTEKFSQSKKGNNDRYDEVARAHPEIWDKKTLNELRDLRWFQLWRNHLLAQALADARGAARARIAVAYHPSDKQCAKAVDGYRALLKDRSLVLNWPIDQVIDAWRGAVGSDPARSAWLEAFELRYLALEASELAWQEHEAQAAP